MHLEPSRQQPPVALEIRNVTKDYDGFVAVSDISFTLAKGEFLTLLGPSGCGKTTLLNLIAGFHAPSGGAILIGGQDVSNLMPHRRNTGVMFQNYALFPHMTVFQNIAFGLEERRLPKARIRESVESILDMVNLRGFDNRKPTQLSGGQQQRVALARALVIEPEVLLLDEPFSALDKSLRTKMQIEIKQIQKRANVATVFVTHDQSEALSMSDRIAVMSKGHIEQMGRPQDVYKLPKTSFVASFVGEVNRIPVTVKSVGDHGMDFEGPVGARLVTTVRQDGFSPGDAADLYVRPEDIKIGGSVGSGSNVFGAKVVACSYQGSFTHVVLNAPGLDELLVAAPAGPHTDNLQPGDSVNLHLELEQAPLLSR